MFNAGRRLVALAAITLAAAGTVEAQMDMGSDMKDKGMAMSQDAMEYTVVFKSRWTAVRHPLEYPAAAAHFSGLIGASHNASLTLFADGRLPTAGMERLSEEGRHMPLDGEIRAAVAAGKAGALVTTGPLKDFGDSIVTTVKVDASYPLVSLVAMIAPSPDWFTGLAGVSLWESGTWVTSKTLDLPAYDSGGDDGLTYRAVDMDNNPKKPTTRASTKHFAPSGVAVPVATVTFTRK